ncbi:MAG: tetratricopeptide repeat protein [Planctomycetota bacterium]|jgi:TolA-binding protein
MKEDELKNLLQEVDRMAGQPGRTQVDVSAVRRRANRRRRARLSGPIAAAAVVFIAAGIWYQVTNNSEQTDGREEIMALQAKVRQLQASTNAAVALIHEVLEDERRQSRLDELEAEYASITDPLDEIQKQVDKTAFILVYQADRLYRELNETESAVETYKRVIKLFPRSQWAMVARERLTEIEGRRI